MRRRGQGNTEFIVIVALIAIATIGVISIFGNNIRLLFAVSSDELAGANNAANAGANGISQATLVTNKNLNTFGQANAYDPQNIKGGGGSGSGNNNAP